MTSFPAMSIERAHALLNQAGGVFELGEANIRGVTTKIWKNAPPTLRDVFALSSVFNHCEHLVHEDERVTIAAFRAAAAKMAQQLIADGVMPGERVAIVMRNLPEWPVAFWGAVLAGAIATPLNAWWTGPELEYGLTDSSSAVLVCDVERYERIREHLGACPALRKIYVSRAREEIADPKVARLEGVVGAPAEWVKLGDIAPPNLPAAPDDDVAIFYTSGTTGHPKGAVLSHRNIVSNMWNLLSSEARGFLRRGEAPPAADPVAPRRISLLSVPFFHATGCCAGVIPALLGGHKLIMQRRWDPDAALELIQR